MFSLFKKKPLPDNGPTFKEHVKDFWKWFGEAAPRFYAEIEAKRCPSLSDEVSENVHQRLPGFGAWEFSANPNGPGHAFTLTGEGNIHLQLLAQYWLERAPKLEGWAFFAARQPDGASGHVLDIAGKRFDPKEFWLIPTLDEEDEKVDLAVWHPMFGSLPEKDRWTIFFLFLDQVLGEYGSKWIGQITFNPERLVDTIAIEELSKYIQQLETDRGWKKYPPGEATTLYTLPEPHQKFARGDVITGVTKNAPLINEFLEANGNLEDPLASTGADYIYVAFDSALLPQGSESETRGKTEDALDGALRAAQSGRLIGGAHGISNAYVDLLIYDGARSLEIVKQSLLEQALAGKATINYFAKEKRGRKIAV